MALIGSHLRPFDLPSTRNGHTTADECVSHAVLLLFYLQDTNPDDGRMLADFNALVAEFEMRNVMVLGVGLEPLDRHAALAETLGLKFPLVSDAQCVLAKMFGLLRPRAVDGKQVADLNRTTLFLGPDLRVVRAYEQFSVDGHAQQVLADVDAYFARDPARDIVQHAPVLMIPNVLPLEVCQRLIALWETENIDSGFMKEIDGKTVGVTDYTHKIRRDHFVKPGPEEDAIKHYLADRVIPEIRRAYNYAVTRREDFRIAQYDSGRGGYFRPHRDNTTGGTAHRRFAMSLLLNDDYDGGYVRFPEFGGHRYRPAAGAAVIFSCSLLHEATDVTAGRRFVLLSFLYGEAEAKQREQYSQRAGQNYKA